MLRMSAFANSLDVFAVLRNDCSSVSFIKHSRARHLRFLAGSCSRIPRGVVEHPSSATLSAMEALRTWNSKPSRLWPLLFSAAPIPKPVVKHFIRGASCGMSVAYSPAVAKPWNGDFQGLCQRNRKLISKSISGKATETDVVTETLVLGQGKELASKDLEFKLFNTMSRQKEVFKPRNPGKVSMYVCGVTVYDYSHIGHARVYVAFDVLYRYLKYLGFEVTYVRNFTDVDDKIINRARELDEDPIHLSRRFCEEFCVDMEMLQCLPPSAEPRVTNHMKQIVEMISQVFI